MALFDMLGFFPKAEKAMEKGNKSRKFFSNIDLLCGTSAPAQRKELRQK